MPVEGLGACPPPPLHIYTSTTTLQLAPCYMLSFQERRGESVLSFCTLCLLTNGDYKHWTQVPGIQGSEDLRIWGLGPSCVALSFYDRNPIESTLWCIQKTLLNTKQVYCTLSASFVYPFFTLQNRLLHTRLLSVTSYTHRGLGVKGHM